MPEADVMTGRYDVTLCLLLLKQFTEPMQTALPPQSRQTEASQPGIADPGDMDLGTQGPSCSNVEPRENETQPTGVFYCPLPFENPALTSCCGEAGKQFCCRAIDTTSMKWGIGIGAVAAGILFIVCAVLAFNKFSYICTNTSPTSAPRPKITINANKKMVRPVDKRTILKTANYTVDQSWEQLVVKFHSEEFFDTFSRALATRYQDVTWRHSKYEDESTVRCSSGDPVNLRVLREPRILIVTKAGNTSWVMNDFQNICKNLQLSDTCEIQMETRRSKRVPLTPRLPTIGEEYYDIGHYKVKTSQTEMEIKFTSDDSFESFKRALLGKYPAVKWSKYLQRDCAQIRLDSGKTITVHLWEEVRTIWLSGDGKKEWYHQEFQELHSKATTGHVSGVYTVKTLESGGLEVEFPVASFLPKLRELLQRAHTSLSWQEYSARQVTTLGLEKGRSVTLHLATPGSGARKMWIYDHPGCKDWFNGEFRTLYAAAYDALYRIEDPTPDGSVIAPVETTL